jgi:hypothetical protein
MNSARNKHKFREENVDVGVNTDVTILLFHPFGE